MHTAEKKADRKIICRWYLAVWETKEIVSIKSGKILGYV